MCYDSPPAILPFQVGQKGKYLFKHNQETLSLDAQVIAIKGSQVVIEFRHPKSGILYQRMLRNPKERVRFTIKKEE